MANRDVSPLLKKCVESSIVITIAASGASGVFIWERNGEEVRKEKGERGEGTSQLELVKSKDPAFRTRPPQPLNHQIRKVMITERVSSPWNKALIAQLLKKPSLDPEQSPPTVQSGKVLERDINTQYIYEHDLPLASATGEYCSEIHHKSVNEDSETARRVIHLIQHSTPDCIMLLLQRLRRGVQHTPNTFCEPDRGEGRADEFKALEVSAAVKAVFTGARVSQDLRGYVTTSQGSNNLIARRKMFARGDEEQLEDDETALALEHHQNHENGTISAECTESPVEDEDRAPDGGWGWVIVFGATMTHFLLVGIARCLGVIYLCLRERYQSSAANTAWVASAFNTSRTLTAPLASMLCERFGCRAVAFVGGLIFSVGLMISAFSTSLLFMLFSFGLLSGFGGVLVFTPAYIIVGQYFDKRKGTAMGLATIGSGLGNVVLAPLINLLLDEYGFFGTMLLLGAIAANTCAVALVYRPRKRKKQKKIKTKKDDEESSVQDTGVLSRIKQKLPSCSCQKPSEGSIFSNSTYLIYCALISFMQYAIMGTLVFVPEFAVEKGISHSEAALLLSIYGFVDLTSRFLYAFLFDLPRVRKQRRYPFALVGIVFGISTMVISMMPNYVALAVAVAFNALFESAFHSQRATVISEFVTPKQMSMAVGMMIASQGIGNITGPPFAGFLRDIYGSNSICFIFGGGCFFTAAVLFSIRILCDRHKHRATAEEVDEPIEKVVGESTA
ncbi:hypothetical protein CAPTEDRAFT_219362 [Capitella teleta]|uniref:Major facilitator superfamily (MFS) profile domain-containing protein n=1 Tax=Capitella teleta TaxID=283909 RepID=R7TFL2_CAPTE|nr:hypothetical protein CAPTEDRAFT_219362 [Capitella teleta]|eukprot:ELT92539.1 hypothetical protein CAPTEDRAFT_219362 [Capitella teleta]